ncbi:MFS transporter [Rathayibacter sp. ZW T2_19]|uniref:MFS transporter n=1 Tax=Rathayibacter rubneri TaxID=2950106 RepID=A0A9X2DVZ0_9MICO|nr:MFS transporter [Rathayibacter rubneri]MCM6761528.1 MFS transporter [Rathayibacter rubneri]
MTVPRHPDGPSGPRAVSDEPSFDLPLSPAASVELGAENIANAVRSGSDERVPLRKRYLAALFFGQFALYVAFVAPIAYSLAVRVGQIAPDTRDTALALAVGIPGVLVVICAPIVGVLSDQTRSRLGRRRPWLLGGAVVALIGSAVIGFTETVPLLIAGWSVAYLGYSVCGAMIATHLGDRLPEGQRGKVMGILGAINQIAPLFGVILGGVLSATGGGLFIGPGLLAFVGTLLFAIVMKDAAFTGPVVRAGSQKILSGFWFNPRRYPNIAWVWVSRALIFMALSFSGLYGIYLLQTRLGLGAAEVATIVSLSGVVSIAAGIGGAIGSGYLSDKLKTRKPFLIVSGVLIAAGLIGTGTTASLAQYVVAGVFTAFAIGVYGAVDQALMLDVLPQDEDENGRYLSILQLGTSVPQAVGPLLAGAVLALFGGGYSGVYFVGAAFAVLGALAIIPIAVGRRAELSTTSIQTP